MVEGQRTLGVVGSRSDRDIVVMMCCAVINTLSAVSHAVYSSGSLSSVLDKQHKLLIAAGLLGLLLRRMPGCPLVTISGICSCHPRDRR